jgi:hypothetical protein
MGSAGAEDGNWLSLRFGAAGDSVSFITGLSFFGEKRSRGCGTTTGLYTKFFRKVIHRGFCHGDDKKG